MEDVEPSNIDVPRVFVGYFSILQFLKEIQPIYLLQYDKYSIIAIYLMAVVSCRVLDTNIGTHSLSAKGLEM